MIEQGAAPTKARPGSHEDRAKKVLATAGTAARQEKPAPPPAAAKQPAKHQKKDNRALAAEAEALYEEILGGDAEPQAKRPSGAKRRSSGTASKAVAASKPPGLLSQLTAFPFRHPVWLLGIVAVAAGVFIALYILAFVTDYATELSAGKAKMNAGAWFEAASHLTKADKLKPDDAEILGLRGECYVKLKRWEEAAADLVASTNLDPANAKNWRLLAESEVRMNKHEAAIKALRKAKGSGDKGSEVQQLMLEALTALGRPGDFVKEFPVSDISILPPSVLTRLATIDLLTQNYEEAKKKAELAVTKTPGEEAPYLLLVRVLRAMGRTDEALRAADTCIAKVALCPQLYYLKAHIQIDSRDFAGAIDTMGLAQSQGGDYLYHTELGNIWMLRYRQTKEAFLKDKAMAAFKQADGSSDGSGFVPMAAGRALLTFGMADAAKKQLQTSVSRFQGTETDPYGYPYKWIASYLLKDWSTAIATLDKAIEANQNTITCLAAKGITYYAMGEKTQAAEAFGKASAMQEGNKIIAPVEYADLSAKDIEKIIKEVGA